MDIQLTPIEQRFWNAAQGIIENLETQKWIHKYRVDFFVPEKSLVIELDGHDYHKSKEQRTHDAKRQRFLESKGYRVIRFTGTEIYRDVNACVSETVNYLAALNNISINNGDEELPLYCSRMQNVIHFLSTKHEFDLDADDDGISLFLNEHFDTLSIEKLGKYIVSVAHYFILNYDVVYDPKIEFLIVSNPIDGSNEWIPINITQYADIFFSHPAYSDCISYEENDKGEINFKILDFKLHQEIANFSEMWGKNLIAQGWLKGSVVKR